jgi:hypothetical protein
VDSSRKIRRLYHLKKGNVVLNWTLGTTGVRAKVLYIVPKGFCSSNAFFNLSPPHHSYPQLSGIVSGDDFHGTSLVLRCLSDEPFTCFTMRAISALRHLMIDLFYSRIFIKDRD